MHSEAFYQVPTFWVLVGFVVFIGLMLYLKVHRTIAAMLDERGTKIAAQLDEARTLKEDAKALLAQFERRQRDAAEDAKAMVALAEEEAVTLQAEAKTALDEMVARRTKLAQEKIGQAEAQAIQEVQKAAVQVAAEAAARVIGDSLDDDARAKLVSGAIGDLGSSLH